MTFEDDLAQVHAETLRQLMMDEEWRILYGSEPPEHVNCHSVLVGEEPDTEAVLEAEAQAEAALAAYRRVKP